MLFAGEVVTLLQLIGFAALLGGALVQLREPAPEINLTMLVGAWVELLTGVTLFLFAASGSGPVNWAELIISALINAFVVVLTVKNRKYADIPRGLLLLIIALTIVNAALPIFW